MFIIYICTVYVTDILCISFFQHCLLTKETTTLYQLRYTDTCLQYTYQNTDTNM